MPTSDVIPIKKLLVKKVEVEPKPSVYSKIIWWDILMAVLQIVDHFALGGMIPQPYGAIVHSVISIVLRQFFTTTPISGVLKVKDKDLVHDNA